MTAKAKAGHHPPQRIQHLPTDAHVVRPGVVERIAEHLHRSGPGCGGRGNIAGDLSVDEAPDRQHHKEGEGG